MRPVRAFLANYLIPVVAVLEGSAAGEHLELISLVGMALVLVAAVLISRRDGAQR